MINTRRHQPLVLVVLGAAFALSITARAADLDTLARSKMSIHRFSTLVDAQTVRDRLKDDAGIDAAIDWCKQTGVTKIYLEEFRDGYQAPRELLIHARDRLRAAGIEVSGCVTTTRLGKKSTGWNGIACYTDLGSQKRIREIFEYAASLFDEIMIDDFWFTDCKCPECDAARKAKTATVDDHVYPVSSDSWADYRGELMCRVSQDCILAPAKKINPKVQVIVKYPQWYDEFHERGYDVIRETALFDRTWVGTETRDYTDHQWGGTAQYEGFFIMRWLGEIGGAKCGGGWYDPFGTTPKTYLEQARQTVLGSAKESVLFCYGALLHGTGPRNIDALRTEIPALLEASEQVQRRQLIGVAAYKPANSPSGKERCVFDFVGMMGVPLVPCHEFPTDAPAAFFSIHAMKDTELPAKLTAFIQKGAPVLITDGLAKKLEGQVAFDRPNVRILPVQANPKRLLSLSDSEVNAIRKPMLAPFKRTFEAPAKVALYLFDDGSSVIENFHDEPASAILDGAAQTIEARSWKTNWK